MSYWNGDPDIRQAKEEDLISSSTKICEGRLEVSSLSPVEISEF